MTARLLPDRVSLLVSDVDGTLVTREKALTERTRDAVRRLRQAGIAFTVVSSRPPRGLRWLIETLDITTPVAGFNGGVIATSLLSPIEQHLIAARCRAPRRRTVVPQRGPNLGVQRARVDSRRSRRPLYRSRGAHREIPPTIVEDFGSALDSAAKIVGVSDDFALLARLEAMMRRTLGADATVARSQPYYLDVTHPLANKGAAIGMLARVLDISSNRIATIGDGANDVAMFKESGLSIAMGNAEPDVKYAADLVTASNDDDGFAEAVERHFLAADRGTR